MDRQTGKLSVFTEGRRRFLGSEQCPLLLRFARNQMFVSKESMAWFVFCLLSFIWILGHWQLHVTSCPWWLLTTASSSTQQLVCLERHAVAKNPAAETRIKSERYSDHLEPREYTVLLQIKSDRYSMQWVLWGWLQPAAVWWLTRITKLSTCRGLPFFYLLSLLGMCPVIYVDTDWIIW